MSWLSADNPVAWWWVTLTAAALLNAVAWVTVSRAALRRQVDATAQERRLQVAVIALAGLYTLGCGFRSVIPRADIERFCLWDTWWSNVFVGRSVATVAELAFAVQGALVLASVSRAHKLPLGVWVARAVVFLIATAECFSWYAVITTDYRGNATEESLWALSYSLVCVALARLAFKAEGTLARLAAAGAGGTTLYVLFMVGHDVPMYLARHQEDVAHPRAFFGLREGVHDLLSRWVVTHQFADWRAEIPWMTLYFTLAVWASIALCLAPLTSAALERLQAPRPK